jgi:hypothetical protein
MTAVGTAIAWQFWRRHRRGLLAIAAYFAILALIRIIILDPGTHFTLDAAESFAMVVVVPLSATFMYCLAIFTFGLDGDIAARESMYPARMFTLPVSTTALTFWPMLYGAVVMALLWFATRLLAVFPAGMPVPVVWPALLAVVLLAWTQALTWMPYAWTGMRVGLAVALLSIIDGIVLIALYSDARELVMIAILAPQLPLAYWVARTAVARARSGAIPVWRGRVEAAGTREFGGRRRRNFSSPARAQRWLEWQRHGWSLPVLVAIVLPFELAMLFVIGDTPILVEYMLVGVLLTPPVMAMFAAAHSRDYGMSPFLATRPVTSAALIAAKLKVALGSTLLTWLLVLGALPLALRWSGTAPLITEPARRIIPFVGTRWAIVFMLLILIVLMATTWKQLVQGLYIGLTGRESLIKGSAFLTLALLFMLGLLLPWITQPTVLATLWDEWPWIPTVLVFLKMSAAVWIVVRLYQTQLVSDRVLVTSAALWCAAVFALYAVLVWLMATPFIPRHLLLLIAILLVPLARVSATPLALAWNRHR